MMELRQSRLAKAAAFIAVHLIALFLILDGIVWPMWARFDDRDQARATMTSELQRIRGIEARTKHLSANTAKTGDPLLASADERMASADLQAILQHRALKAGTRFLSVRGVASPKAPVRMVAARLDIEGPASTVQNAIADIEAGSPFLFVTSATIRTDNGGAVQSDLIHAELVVEAAMKPLKATETPGLSGWTPRLANAEVP